MPQQTFFQCLSPIIKKNNLAANVYDFHLLAPDIATCAMPGQFVQVSVPGFFLRRPISICEIDRTAGLIRLVVEQRGAGTQALAQFHPGDTLDLLGPLGQGFTLFPYNSEEKISSNNTAVVIGGGIGVPPLLAVSAHYGKYATAILGFRTAAATILAENFKDMGNKLILCTDDGTAGEQGFVTQALERNLQNKHPDIIYACGPHGMLKAVAAVAQRYGVVCEVSLEERMGCGVGACLGCACPVNHTEQAYYAHVCKDGPVFNAQQVLFEEQDIRKIKGGQGL